MPSPIGHALAGVATAWAADLVPRPAAARSPSTAALGAACCALALLPDIDLLYMPMHRAAMHSVGAVFIVFIIAAGVTGWVTGRTDWRTALVCALAYASHLLLDWLGADASVPYGIQALWPFSDRWVVSPVAVFPGTERRYLLSWSTLLINARAAIAEIAIMGPLVLAARWARSRTGRPGRAGGTGR